MKHWFKDQHLRSLLRNSSYLGISRIVAAVCGIGTIALAGRGLGLLLLGTLILITSYTKASRMATPNISRSPPASPSRSIC